VAFYPKAIKRLIYPENDTAPFLATKDRKPTTFIYHSAVGFMSLFDYFNRKNIVLESHCWIGLDGQVEQYLDNARRADANYKANPFAMSWETADNGHPDSFEWTPSQTLAIAESMVWGNKLYGIPLALPKTWDSPGMGYHTMWGAPSNWTPVAKSCPGKVRKAQFPIILRAANELKRLEENPPMAGFDINAPVSVTGSAKAFLEDRGADVGADNTLPYSWFVVWGHINGVQQLEQLVRLEKQLDSIRQNTMQTVANTRPV
jgi:hypothetical protein